jgi:hypothetical protein
MANARKRRTTGVDGDGVRVTRGPSRFPDRGVVAAAVAGIVGAFILARQYQAHEDPSLAVTPDVMAVASDRSEVAGPAAELDAVTSLPESPRRRRLLARRLARKLPRTYGPEGRPELQAADAIAALRAAGVRDGIAAFPPPGTDPPKRGIVVPDGFALPEGYIRHYQTTDEGESLPPILMLHPDYELVDENGNPITAPEDGVVPPELAPPGLPVEMLDLPGRETGSAP